jgi:hypothetical protein
MSLKSNLVDALMDEFPSATVEQATAAATLIFNNLREPILRMYSVQASTAEAIWSTIVNSSEAASALATFIRNRFSVTVARATTVAARVVTVLNTLTEDIALIGNTKPTHIVAWRAMVDSANA